MKDNIIEGNKLIVAFMGGKQVDSIRRDGHDYQMFDLPASFPCLNQEPDMFGMKRTGYLGFHCSWDWLIAVVEKIETLTDFDGRGEVNYIVSIEANQCIISQGGEGEIEYEQCDTKIEATWKACVQFIQWKNAYQAPKDIKFENLDGAINVIVN